MQLSDSALCEKGHCQLPYHPNPSICARHSVMTIVAASLNTRTIACQRRGVDDADRWLESSDLDSLAAELGVCTGGTSWKFGDMASPTIKMLVRGHVLRSTCRPYTSASTSNQPKVQTPIQAQPASPTAQPSSQTPLQTPVQGQTPLQSQVPSHRPSVAERRAKQWPPSDAAVKWIVLAAIPGIPALVYYWYEHRKEHMRQKKTQILKEAQASSCHFSQSMRHLARMKIHLLLICFVTLSAATSHLSIDCNFQRDENVEATAIRTTITISAAKRDALCTPVCIEVNQHGQCIEFDDCGTTGSGVPPGMKATTSAL
ncbi:hypothetical protein EJ03DRAFT_383934 [Teratosphaeria nubilosa]|uniref:Uncharacterized protein n=1 Tax=Teratosphaeria nubilosa TaxID=161662 RepID=A0A6G1L445_9PEZI|nr:hypothetical protein EJ03DRAFT_383934 [Teratosphaeria nubilosa]